MCVIRMLTAAIVATAAATAQQALFFRDKNLVATGPTHNDVAAAVQRLCAGPTSAQHAAGIRSHLPPGTAVVTCRRSGSNVQVTLNDAFLNADTACDLEHAVEQIDKTVLSAPGIDACELFVQRRDGTVVELGVALGRPPAPLAAPAAQKRPLPSPDEIIRAAKTEPPAKKPLPKAGDIILARSLVSVQKRTTTQPQKGISFGGYANDYLEVVNKTLQVNRTQEDRAEAVAAASRATAGGGAARVAQAKELALKPVNVVTKPTVSGDVKDVVETRLTGFTVHALVLASLGFAPVLAEVPLAVVWGVFLFLGFKVMAGNQFLGRVGSLFVDTGMLNPTSETERAVVELGRKRVLRYTAVQASCLAALWLLKLNKATAMVFPSVIGVLLVLRASLLPRVFSPRELLTLDTEIDR